jgi:RsiW-degrading membrane proteinase PrsW (M82 family)
MEEAKYTREECLLIPFHKPDAKEKIFFFLSGTIMSIPLTLFAETISAYFLNARPAFFYTELVLATIIAPLIEEFFKAYPLFYRHGETEKSILALGFYTGLGFGLIEFLLYTFVYDAPFVVRFFLIFFHAANTSILAYGIAKKKSVRFFFIAAMLHFLYNFSAYLGNSWFLVGLICVPLSVLTALFLRLKTTEKIIEF